LIGSLVFRRGPLGQLQKVDGVGAARSPGLHGVASEVGPGVLGDRFEHAVAGPAIRIGGRDDHRLRHQFFQRTEYGVDAGGTGTDGLRRFQGEAVGED
jgi:hypothetical protein